MTQLSFRSHQLSAAKLLLQFIISAASVRQCKLQRQQNISLIQTNTYGHVYFAWLENIISILAVSPIFHHWIMVKGKCRRTPTFEGKTNNEIKFLNLSWLACSTFCFAIHISIECEKHAPPLKAEQRSCLKALTQGKNVFAVLPTGL